MSWPSAPTADSWRSSRGPPIAVWDCATGTKIVELKDGTDLGSSAPLFSPDGSQVFARGRYGDVRVWDIRKARLAAGMEFPDTTERGAVGRRTTRAGAPQVGRARTMGPRHADHGAGGQRISRRRPRIGDQRRRRSASPPPRQMVRSWCGRIPHRRRWCSAGAPVPSGASPSVATASGSPPSGTSPNRRPGVLTRHAGCARGTSPLAGNSSMSPSIRPRWRSTGRDGACWSVGTGSGQILERKRGTTSMAQFEGPRATRTRSTRCRSGTSTRAGRRWGFESSACMRRRSR